MVIDRDLSFVLLVNTGIFPLPQRYTEHWRFVEVPSSPDHETGGELEANARLVGAAERAKGNGDSEVWRDYLGVVVWLAARLSVVLDWMYVDLDSHTREGGDGHGFALLCVRGILSLLDGMCVDIRTRIYQAS